MHPPGTVGCPVCGHQNRPNRRFCAKCGSRFGAPCAACGAQNEAGDGFCGSCGAALTATPPASQEQRETVEGERRQLTVLFCDLVGSTELAARLDPEEWSDVVRTYQRSAAEVVARLEGHVAQYLGDGVLVYFGWPRAHDDGAERAVRAGLGLVDAVAGVNPARLGGAQLAVRVGIHTGLVVVDQREGETLALGDPPNIAARVQSLADANTVLITAATHRLVTGLFVVEDRGTHALKGVGEPLQLYRVVQGSGVRGRLHAAAARGLSPFVGREDERRLLRTRWELACEGDGQVVLITGEAGIGKSRLVQQFKEDLGSTPHTWIECGASPYLRNTPFHPIVDLLQQGLALGVEIAATDPLERIERGLATAGLKPAEAIPLVAPLIGLSLPERYPRLLLGPDQQRRKLMATLVAWVCGFARLQPLVIVFEDLHNIDPSTLEVLELLVDQGATEQMLVLFTARPEFRPSWPMRSHHAQVTLTRMSRRQVRELVARVAARVALAEDMVETVVARTDGVPLFVEEFVRLLLEGEGSSLLREIPVTLQDSLMARLDRLGSAKEVAQVAAVVGAEFSYALLEAVVRLPEPELQAALARLVDAELVYPRGLTPEATYVFKHTLLQDAAYASLLKSRRRDLHRAIAHTLVEKFPDLVETQPQVLAHHHGEGGDIEPAVAAWQQAGERATARFALVEAGEHYAKALTLLRSLPETPARIRRELALLVPVALAQRATKGWASPEAVETLARARRLSEQLGDMPQLLVVLQGLWTSALTSGELSAAQDLADQLLEVGERDGTPAMLVWPRVAQGLTRFLRGDPTTALEHLDRARALHDGGQSSGGTSDPGVAAHSQSGPAAATLGLADRAREHVRHGLALAQRAGRPYDLALAWMGGTLTHTALRDPDAVLHHVVPLVEIATAHQLTSFAAIAGVHQAWALMRQGRHADVILQLRSAVGVYLAGGQRAGHGQYLGLLADAYLQAGSIEEGLATIEDALVAVPEEGIYMPELLRIRGDLRARNGSDTSPAETSYREAIAFAQRIGAKLVELRATTSLGHLLRAHRRAAEARGLLAPLYASFTEGFDARDLVEAKALMAELD